MGPKPTGEPMEGLMTEKGEPSVVVGLLEAELMFCCEDMAVTLRPVCVGQQSEDRRDTVKTHSLPMTSYDKFF